MSSFPIRATSPPAWRATAITPRSRNAGCWPGWSAWRRPPWPTSRRGHCPALEDPWLRACRDALGRAAWAAAPPRALHGDSQAANVMVRGVDHRYAAVLDWGGARLGDPAMDFAGVPLRAGPFMLEGYRES